MMPNTTATPITNKVRSATLKINNLFLCFKAAERLPIRLKLENLGKPGCLDWTGVEVDAGGVEVPDIISGVGAGCDGKGFAAGGFGSSAEPGTVFCSGSGPLETELSGFRSGKLSDGFFVFTMAVSRLVLLFHTGQPISNPI